MWLNKLNDMSVGPLWVLRTQRATAVETLPASATQSDQDCPTCGAPRQYAGSKETLIVLHAPLTDAGQQTLLQNCLHAAGLGDATILMQHLSCAQPPEISLQLLKNLLIEGGPKAVVVFGSAAALGLDASFVHGQIHSYQNTRLIVTHHPEEMIATPALKAKVWADLCLVHAD